jgi:hypothetical protein
LRSVKDGEQITVDLCPVHLLDAQKAISEMEEVRRIEVKTPERSALLPWSRDGEAEAP